MCIIWQYSTSSNIWTLDYMNPQLSEHGLGLIAHVQQSRCCNELNFSVVQRIVEQAKQRKVALTIGKKLEIIKSMDAGSSFTVVAEKYGTCIA